MADTLKFGPEWYENKYLIIFWMLQQKTWLVQVII